MDDKRAARLGLAFRLFCLFGATSVLGDILGHTLGLKLLDVPVTFQNLMAGSPRTGHVEIGYLLGLAVFLAGASLVGRAFVLSEKMRG